jgi:hypothetical protein
VLALPPQELAPLMAGTGEPALQPLANAARCFRPSPYQSTYIWFDRPITTERFWARTWSLQGLNTDFYNLSAIRPGLAGKPTLVACNAIGPQVRSDWDDGRIVAQTLRRDRRVRAVGAPGPRAAHARAPRADGDPATAARHRGDAPAGHHRHPGLWIAGDWTDTQLPCSMESAARSGALAAEAVLDKDGRESKLAIAAPETRGLIGLLRRR